MSTTSLCALAWATGIPPASLSRLLRCTNDPGLITLELALVATDHAVWCIDPRGCWHPILTVDAPARTTDDHRVADDVELAPLTLVRQACRRRGLSARALANTSGIAVASAHRLLSGTAPRRWRSVGGLLAALGYRLVVADATGDLIGLTLPALRTDAGQRSHSAHLAALNRYRSRIITTSTSRRRGHLLMKPEHLVKLAAEGVPPAALAAMAGVGMARLRQVLTAHGSAARTSAIGQRIASNLPRLIVVGAHAPKR